MEAEKDLLRSTAASQSSKPTYDQLEAMARTFEVLFLFYLYGYTIKPYLINLNHWFDRTKMMRMVMMTYMLPTPLTRWPVVYYICFVYAPNSPNIWYVSPSLFLSATNRLIWQVIWLIFCWSFRVETGLCLIIFARFGCYPLYSLTISWTWYEPHGLFSKICRA